MKTIRVAAAGDIHAGSGEQDRVREAFKRVEEQADLVLLAGDLTQHGQVDEVCVVADACRDLAIPVVAVLGNHDWQSDRPADLARALSEAGVVVLDRSHTVLPVQGVSVGIAGVKGFVGGFGNQWANFGEPERLWLVLGADRLAGPIREHRPHLVVHGHAHHGSFEGRVDDVPVYNVAVHVTGREFWVFELSPEHAEQPLAVEEA